MINKAGGLVYVQDFGSVPSKCSGNDYLIIASTFQRYFFFSKFQFYSLVLLRPTSLHAISVQVSPVANSSGIETMECGTLHLYCLQTVTGTALSMRF